MLYREGRFEDPSARIDLQDMTFTATATENTGGVLLSALGDGTMGFRNEHLETVVSAKETPGTVISLAATRDGKIWLGTQDNGLFRVSNGSICQSR